MNPKRSQKDGNNVLTLLLVIVVFQVVPTIPASLGVPCGDKPWYARNIWDMQIYENRLYVGCGNSSNSGPAPNSGPVAVWAYSAEGGWQTELTVDEEQIDRFVLIDGVLTIPGHDSREGWEFGNWYSRGDQVWTKHRNIPNGIHVYDLTTFDNKWFAALGTAAGSSIGVSTDNGETWTAQIVPSDASINWEDVDYSASCTGTEITIPVARVYGFFEVSDDLFANLSAPYKYICSDNRWVFTQEGPNVLTWDGTRFSSTSLDPFGMTGATRVVRPVIYRDHTVYIAANTVNDHQWQPVGLFAIDSRLQAEPLSPPLCTRPQDIKTNNDVLYVLCNQYQGASWEVTVSATCDLTNWDQVATFDAPTFARSFALSQEGYIYIGLGADTDAPGEAREAVGQVLQLQPRTISECRS